MVVSICYTHFLFFFFFSYQKDTINLVNTKSSFFSFSVNSMWHGKTRLLKLLVNVKHKLTLINYTSNLTFLHIKKKIEPL